MITVIQVYSIAGHGKGEDHVGGLAKVTVRREVAAGETLQFSCEMIDRLRIKFGHKHDPKYDFKDITTEELEQAREKEWLTV